MRKDFGSKPYLYPQLVMIIGTYDKDGNPNAMNAAWGGMADYNKVMVCMSSHKTTKNIEYTNEFTISIADDKHVIESDYVGIVSQNKEPNKMEKSGFTTSIVPSVCISAAVTSHGPFLDIFNDLTSVSSGLDFKHTSFKLRMMFVTSSITPGTVENSCSTPSILIVLIA